jgi:hypothetical protein
MLMYEAVFNDERAKKKVLLLLTLRFRTASGVSYKCPVGSFLRYKLPLFELGT